MSRLVLVAALAASSCATATPSPFRLRFAVDADSEKQLLFRMFHEPDPAGLEARARSMKVPVELARQVRAAKDYPEVAGEIAKLVDARYAAVKAEMAAAQERQQRFWDANLAEVSALTREITGVAWFHPDYRCNLTAFQRGASSWYGNVLHVGFDLEGDLDKRIVAHELLLSHAFHLFRRHFDRDAVDDWKVWAFSEIAAVLIMDDARFDHLWPRQVHHEADYFARTNYTQIAPLEARMRAAYRDRKDFADFVQRAAGILRETGDPLKESGEPPGYLVLVEGDVRQSADGLVARLKVKVPLDEKSLAPSEWDLLVDADQDLQTRPWGALPAVRDLGVDCLVRLLWTNGQFKAELVDYRPPGKRRVEIPYSVVQDTIELRFPSSLVGNPARFDYVLLARPLTRPGEGPPSVSRLPKATFESR